MNKDIRQVNATAAEINEAVKAVNNNEVLTNEQKRILFAIDFKEMQAREIYEQMLNVKPVVTYNVDAENLLKLTDQQHKQLKPEHFSRITELTEEARNKAMQDRFDSVRYGLEHEELSPMQELIKEHIKGADLEFMKTEEGLDLILGKLRHLITNQQNENELHRKKIEAYEQVAKKVPHIHRQAKQWKEQYLNAADQAQTAIEAAEKLKSRLDKELAEKEEMSEEIHFLRKEVAHYMKGHSCEDHQQIEYAEANVYVEDRLVNTIQKPVRVVCGECENVLWDGKKD